MSGLQKKSRFRFRAAWLLGAVLIAIAGCGAPNADKANDSPAAEPAQQAAEFPKVIKDAKGEVALESKPETIAVTYFPYAEHLFAIGQADAVTGVAGLKSLQNFPVYKPFVSDGRIADLGDEANLEKIMALNPDVIITSDYEEAIYDKLVKIAPTIVIPVSEKWEDTITKVAEVIGEEESAQQYIDSYHKKMDEVAARMEQSGEKGKTAVFMMTWGKGFYYYSGPRMEPYYKQLGFKEFDDMEDYGEISLEGLSKWNPDYIFLGQDFTNAAELTADELAKNAVWNSLAAVKNKKMFIVDTEIVGPLAMGQFKGLEFMDQIMSGNK